MTGADIPLCPVIAVRKPRSPPCGWFFDPLIPLTDACPDGVQTLCGRVFDLLHHSMLFAFSSAFVRSCEGRLVFREKEKRLSKPLQFEKCILRCLILFEKCILLPPILKEWTSSQPASPSKSSSERISSGFSSVSSMISSSFFLLTIGQCLFFHSFTHSSLSEFLLKPFNFQYKICCISIAGFAIILLMQIILNSLKLNARCTFFSNSIFEFLQKKCSKSFTLMLVCNDDFLQGIADNIIVLLEISNCKTDNCVFVITHDQRVSVIHRYHLCYATIYSFFRPTTTFLRVIEADIMGITLWISSKVIIEIFIFIFSSFLILWFDVRQFRCARRADFSFGKSGTCKLLRSFGSVKMKSCSAR